MSTAPDAIRTSRSFPIEDDDDRDVGADDRDGLGDASCEAAEEVGDRADHEGQQPGQEEDQDDVEEVAQDLTDDGDGGEEGDDRGEDEQGVQPLALARGQARDHLCGQDTRPADLQAARSPRSGSPARCALVRRPPGGPTSNGR